MVYLVVFFINKYSLAERNYPIYTKKLLAIIRAIAECHAELEATEHPVQVITNYHNYKYYTTSQNLSRRQAQWAEFLSQFNFLLNYVPSH